MTDHTDPLINAVPNRQLLHEFEGAFEPGSEQPLLDHVLDAVQGLNLQPMQLEHIRKVFLQAIARARRSGDQAAISRLRVRIWVPESFSCEHGWGFFVVEKGDVSESGGEYANYLVELFLYQEYSS